jgi:integrase
MAKRTTGLVKRGGIWHINKRASYLPGGRLRESTGKATLEEAELYLARRLTELRERKEKPSDRTFARAAVQYLSENDHLRTIMEQASILERMMPFIGELPLRQVHRGTLQTWVDHCYRRGRKAKTVNNSFAVVRRILNLSARLWRDESGNPYLAVPPLIPDEPVRDAAKPYPLSWAEQHELFSRLPAYRARMALFKVNVGCREQEVCGLKWEWEVKANGRSVFILPAGFAKNGDERLVVLNSIAQSVVDSVRGEHPVYVFSHEGKRVPKIYGKAWKAAWKAAGLPEGPTVKKGVHNLRHTFGRRLRAAGVPLETRKALLGHRNGDLTTHYSAAEIEELQKAVDAIVEQRPGTVLRAVG